MKWKVIVPSIALRAVHLMISKGIAERDKTGLRYFVTFVSKNNKQYMYCLTAFYGIKIELSNKEYEDTSFIISQNEVSDMLAKKSEYNTILFKDNRFKWISEDEDDSFIGSSTTPVGINIPDIDNLLPKVPAVGIALCTIDTTFIVLAAKQVELLQHEAALNKQLPGCVAFECHEQQRYDAIASKAVTFTSMTDWQLTFTIVTMPYILRYGKKFNTGEKV